MKVIQLTPGAGEGFYCENCLRDGSLVREVRQMGHDMSVMPLYLPLRREQEVAGAETDVFFGGVNVYLQQKWRLFRRTPRWLDRLFDARGLLKRIANRTAMTDATLLGETMLSMLRGEEGNQAKELDRLVEFLRSSGRPDVVCLSNALLAGLARRIAVELSVPVVCQLQDEEGFLDALDDDYRSRAWDLLSERCTDIAAFIPVSEFYGEVMQRRLGLDPQRVHVVYGGIDAALYASAPSPPQVPAIGYLSQMTAHKGLRTLVEAFVLLKRHPAMGSLQLRVAGGKTQADDAYLREIHQRLRQEGLSDDVEMTDNIDSEEKLKFLQSLSLLSVPTVRGEAFGMFVLETLACGVPLVLPRHGAFVELARATGGIELCEPNDPQALADAMAPMLLDASKAHAMGERGREAVASDFSLRRMAAASLDVFEAVAGAGG